MRFINIVDSVEMINYGIWNPVLVNVAVLVKHGVRVEIWYPGQDLIAASEVVKVPLSSLSIKCLKYLIKERSLNPLTDIILTHGSWRFATRWGARLKRLGFTWVYTPHGMLEPWPLKHKRIKKKIYFAFVEKKMAETADLIRAVSLPERKNLQRLFKSSVVEFIPNGITIDHSQADLAPKKKLLRYLFLSRLHGKKNVSSLAEAWILSKLNNDPQFELVIAGPDHGELKKLDAFLKQSSNMKYVGSVYGADKTNLLQASDFYVLPSFSEGLPTALLEAMSYGLVPLITDGCNLPEVVTENLGFRIETNKQDILTMLEHVSALSTDDLQKLSRRNKNFIAELYSTEAVTQQQLQYVSEAMERNKSKIT